jgi:hypothetical protein
MGSGRKDEEMICALTAEEHTALQKGLGQLAETMPPRAVWHRIREQAEAEGLLQQTVMRKRSTWYAGFGVAAAALLAAVMLPGTFQTPTGQGTNVSPVVMTDTPVELNALQTLMVRHARRHDSDDLGSGRPHCCHRLSVERSNTTHDAGRPGAFLARTREVNEFAARFALCASATGGFLVQE